MDIPRTLLPALAAAVLAVGATVAPATAAVVTPSPAATAAPTAGSGPCQVVGTWRAGRAWLPGAALAVPGGRVEQPRVRSGAARVDLVDGRLHVQRTSRRSPAAAAPVEVELSLHGPDGSTALRCLVDLDAAHVDPATRLRRVAAGG